jgi:transposase
MPSSKTRSTRYTDNFKRSVVAKLTVPGAPSAYSMQEQLGVSSSTLYKWIQVYGNGSTMKDKHRTPKSFSPEEKFQALMDTAKLAEHELGKHLRQNGLRAADLEKWQAEFKTSLASQKVGRAKRDPERTALKAEVKVLKREIARKDKALAEAAALIILKKKADILFGATEAGQQD